jgi:hypothetical protein
MMLAGVPALSEAVAELAGTLRTIGADDLAEADMVRALAP